MSGLRERLGDETLTRLTDPEGGLRIECRHKKPGWLSRSGAGKELFPGSTVLFEGRHYEVRNIEQSGSGDFHYSYTLAPWEDRFPIRVQFHYSAEECERLASERSANRSHGVQGLLLRLLMPLAGALPGVDQERLANHFGITAYRMTLFSAWVGFLLGGYAAILTAAAMFGGMAHESNLAQILRLAGCLLFVESAIRLLSSAKLEEPMGSAFIALPIGILRSIKNAFDPDRRASKREAMQSKRDQNLYLNAVDEVKEVSGGDHDLEVISALPKPHWNVLTGILYRDTWFGLIETKKLRTDDTTRYLFLLKRAPDGMVFRSATHYVPEEIQQIYKSMRHDDLGTWSDTFSVFWGLLPQQDQLRLKQEFGFDALKYTKWTIYALTAIGAANLFASAMSILAGLGNPGEVIWLVISGYLLGESFHRWRILQRELPSGSIFGWMFRPFAARLR
jgi:hypothetical protein